MDTNLIRTLYKKRFKGIFIDCIPLDALQNQILVRKLCNQMETSLPKFMIVNTDVSSKKGSHWFLLQKIERGKFFIFDSYGAYSSNELFKFDSFSEKVIVLNEHYDSTLFGQFFQYSKDSLLNDTTFNSNKLQSFKFSKKIFKSLSAKFKDTMSEPMNFLTLFLEMMCNPDVINHEIFYFTCQLQPFNTIICGELCVYVAEIIHSFLKINERGESIFRLLSALDHELKKNFRKCQTPKMLVDYIKQFMIETFDDYIIKKDNVKYFEQEIAKFGEQLLN